MRKVAIICNKLILAIGLVILAFIGGASIVLHGYLIYETERMTFIRNDIWFYLLLAVLLFVLWTARGLIGRIPAKKLFIVCSIFYFLAGLYICFRAPEKLNADSWMIHKYAMQFMEGDYKGLGGEWYLRYYPFQLGMVTYETGLLSVWNNIRIFFIANLVWIIGIQYFQWKNTRLIFRSNSLESCCILLSFGFAPMLFYVLFAYGNIPGYFLTCLAFNCFIKYVQQDKIICAIGGSLCLGVAIIFKPNYILAVIVCFIILFMEFLKNATLKRAAIIVLVIVLSITPNKMFIQIWRNISGIDFDGRAPMFLNVTMGLQPEEMQIEGERLGGWYNGYNEYTFKKCNFDVDKANQVAKEDGIEIIKYWFSGTSDPSKFFGEKILSTWCDPLFELVFSGPVEFDRAEISDRILHSLYDHDRVEMIILRYMNVLIVFVYLSAALWCFRGLRTKELDSVKLFYLLLFFGGFFFHLISETKSQYAFTYAYGLIPYAACMLYFKE